MLLVNATDDVVYAIPLVSFTSGSFTSGSSGSSGQSLKVAGLSTEYYAGVNLTLSTYQPTRHGLMQYKVHAAVIDRK